MILVFDTSVIIGLERKEKNTIEKVGELSKIYNSQPHTTFVTYFELVYGILNRTIANQNKSIEFLKNFSCLGATEKTANHLAKLKHKFDKKGEKIPLADLIIASQVLENNATLLTKDRSFEKIDDIRTIII